MKTIFLIFTILITGISISNSQIIDKVDSKPLCQWEKMNIPPCDSNNLSPSGIRQIFAVRFDTKTNKMFVANRFNGNDNSGVLVSRDLGQTFTAIGPEGNWTLKAGPNDKTFEVHPQNSDWLYLGSEGRGFFVSFDGGKSWKNSFIGAAGNKEKKVSYDGGLTWEKPIITGEGHGFKIDFDPRNKMKIWGSTQSGIIFSEDAGKTWSKCNVPVSQTNQIIIDKKNPDRIYASQTWPKGNLLRSLDGGITWAKMHNGIDTTKVTPNGYDKSACWKILIHPDDNNVLFAITAGGLYTSRDGGNNWNLLAFGTKNNTMNSFLSMEISVNNPDVMVTGGRHLRISKDGGKTWDDLTGNLPIGIMPNREYGIRVTDIVFDPNNPEMLYVARTDGLYRLNISK